MTPSSGARSGTVPSRAGRGAGDGRVGVYTHLKCGHDTSTQPVAQIGTKRYYRCPDGCGLQAKGAPRAPRPA